MEVAIRIPDYMCKTLPDNLIKIYWNKLQKSEKYAYAKIGKTEHGHHWNHLNNWEHEQQRRTNTYEWMNTDIAENTWEKHELLPEGYAQKENELHALHNTDEDEYK